MIGGAVRTAAPALVAHVIVSITMTDIFASVRPAIPEVYRLPTMLVGRPTKRIPVMPLCRSVAGATWPAVHFARPHRVEHGVTLRDRSPSRTCITQRELGLGEQCPSGF